MRLNLNFCTSRVYVITILLIFSPFNYAQNVTKLYDLVIENGRVIDPETSLDQIRNVAINGGKIVKVSGDALLGRTTINAENKVVTAGFIDIHSHTPTLLGQHMGLLDGITTQLDLEAGAYPIKQYGEHLKGGAQMNYGASVGHFAIRTKVMDGIDQPYIFSQGKAAKFGGKAFTQPASDAQIEAMRLLIHQGLDEGGLGIGVLLDYMTRAVSPAELEMVFNTAAARQVPVYVHVRRGYTGDPKGLYEVIELAKRTQAALLVCHITHNAMGQIKEWLAAIDHANEHGANITTETLSYAAGGTSISADVFVHRDWRKMFDIDYHDVQWVATGEWLTKESWEKYSREQPNGMVNHHYVKEQWIETALKWPKMMVSTDALPAFDRDVFTNPNVSGTFARVLGHYVRDRKILTLNEGLTRLSLNQAKWMEHASPLFAKKGRIQESMDADIVIFDPKTIKANADYGKPYLASSSIEFVLVAGRIVVANGQQLEGRYPGKKLLNTRVNTRH